jgi:Tol biopolymer transport system component
VPDVFLRDRVAGTTVRVSVGPGGVELAQMSQEPFVSADGRFVAFSSFDDTIVPFDGNGFLDVFVYEVATGQIECASIALTGTTGDEHSLMPSLSADGRFCAFMSDAQRSVHGDNNQLRDVFVRDLVNDTTTRVSVTSAGIESATGLSMTPSISGDGRFVSFASLA